jgi:hypothetical protein
MDSAKAIMPSDPSRADHRIIRYVLKNFFPKETIIHQPGPYDRVAKVFMKAGGSWERLFKGSVRDINLLKLICKIALDNDVIPKGKPFR